MKLLILWNVYRMLVSHHLVINNPYKYYVRERLIGIEYSWLLNTTHSHNTQPNYHSPKGNL
jgi:hypothetical protein